MIFIRRIQLLRTVDDKEEKSISLGRYGREIVRV